MSIWTPDCRDRYSTAGTQRTPRAATEGIMGDGAIRCKRSKRIVNGSVRNAGWQDGLSQRGTDLGFFDPGGDIVSRLLNRVVTELQDLENRLLLGEQITLNGMG